jgi:hypothetical protein
VSPWLLRRFGWATRLIGTATVLGNDDYFEHEDPEGYRPHSPNQGACLTPPINVYRVCAMHAHES